MAIMRERLSSSAISEASYDPDTEVLTIYFTSGQSYDFDGVPQDVYEGLISSSSPGRYFHSNIKGIFG